MKKTIQTLLTAAVLTASAAAPSTTYVFAQNERSAPIYGPPWAFYPPGDANHDDMVDARDITTMQNIILGKNNDSLSSACADIDHDGKVDENDIHTLLNFLTCRRQKLSEMEDVDENGCMSSDDYQILEDAVKQKKSDAKYDVNEDGAVDDKDLKAVEKRLAEDNIFMTANSEFNPTDYAPIFPDINQDGKVDTADLTLRIKQAEGIEEPDYTNTYNGNRYNCIYPLDRIDEVALLKEFLKGKGFTDAQLDDAVSASGDINLDGKLDEKDYAELSKAIKSKSTDLKYDFVSDGRIDGADLDALQNTLRNLRGIIVDPDSAALIGRCDVTNDGHFTDSDYYALLNYLKEKKENPDYAYDVDGSGTTDIDDLLILVKNFLETPFVKYNDIIGDISSNSQLDMDDYYAMKQTAKNGLVSSSYVPLECYDLNFDKVIDEKDVEILEKFMKKSGDFIDLDVNRDGDLTADDLTAISDKVARDIEKTDYLYDVNRDGSIDDSDLQLVEEFLIKYGRFDETLFSIESE